MTNSSDSIYHLSDPAVQISNSQKDMSSMTEKYSKFKDQSQNSEENDSTRIDISAEGKQAFEVEMGENSENKGKKGLRLILKGAYLRVLMMSPEEYEEMGPIEKILTFIELPLIKMRDFTIPPADESKYRRVLGAIIPLCTSVSVILFSGMASFKIKEIPLLAIVAPVSILAGLVILFLSKSGQYPKWRSIIHVFSLVMSVFWIYQIAKILLDFLDFFALNTKLNQVFVGSTLLAWGNSVGDYFSNSAVSKQGFAVMAVTGCFSGQLFNLLVGFGVNILRATITKGTYSL